MTKIFDTNGISWKSDIWQFHDWFHLNTATTCSLKVEFSDCSWFIEKLVNDVWLYVSIPAKVKPMIVENQSIYLLLLYHFNQYCCFCSKNSWRLQIFNSKKISFKEEIIINKEFLPKKQMKHWKTGKLLQLASHWSTSICWIYRY